MSDLMQMNILDETFRSIWLRIALGETEYAAVKDLPIPLLASLYKPVYEAGPLGLIWYAQLNKMQFILDDRHMIDPFDFVAAFKRTYTGLAVPLFSDLPKWQMIKKRAADDFNTTAVQPVFTQPDTLPSSIESTFYVRQLKQTNSSEHAGFLLNLRTHAVIVLSRYLLESEPRYTNLLREHDEFTRKWNLL